MRVSGFRHQNLSVALCGLVELTMIARENFESLVFTISWASHSAFRSHIVRIIAT